MKSRLAAIRVAQSLVNERALMVRAAYKILHDRDASEDVVGDILLWAWKNQKALPRNGSLSKYLQRASRNRALNTLRNARTQTRLLSKAFSEKLLDEIMQDSKDSNSHNAELFQMWMALPARMRQIAILRWQLGFSPSLIASYLGVAVPTVSNTLTKAAKRIRQLTPNGSF